MTITLTDIFAGAGGSSTGATQVPGVHVTIAANHWQLAVDVHADNHQTTDHACVDLHLEDPRNFPRTDMLWASPECTKWSIANSRARELSLDMGGDPTLFDDVPADLETTDEDEATRSRLLMFDVLRFIEHHQYRAVIVENVVDIATQARYATAWASWQRGLRSLGYDFRVVSLNSMHAQLGGAPAPQSRDRLYIVAWPAGAPAPDIDRALSPAAHCPHCDRHVMARQSWKRGRTVGRYRAQYVYVCPDCHRQVEPPVRPASDAIDWSIPAERIGDRRRPLSAKTMARIREGLRRYGTPHIIEAAGNTYDMASGSGNQYLRAWPVSEPLRTLHGTASKGIVMDETAPSHMRPLLVPSGGTWHNDATTIDKPLRTVTTRESHALLVPYYSASETAKPVTEPVGTLTTVDRYALAIPHDYPSDDDVAACRFRMLEPHEIAAGMSFPRDYRWQGSKRDRVKLAGNAVTPPAARDLVQVVADSLEAA